MTINVEISKFSKTQSRRPIISEYFVKVQVVLLALQLSARRTPFPLGCSKIQTVLKQILFVTLLHSQGHGVDVRDRIFLLSLLTRDVHKVSFPLVSQPVNPLLCVRDRVMILHDASTSGTCRVLTVASLQRLKMEALIPAPADGEVRSVLKFFVCTEHSADRNSSHWARIQRVQGSNPGAEQTDWGCFRGFPQLSRQMLCCIYITTIHINIIHKIHKLQILRQ